MSNEKYDLSEIADSTVLGVWSKNWNNVIPVHIVKITILDWLAWI